MKQTFNRESGAEDRQDVYERVTTRIVADLERGVRPWTQPWKTGDGRAHRPRRHNGVPYSGVNVLMLWSASVERGFESSQWMTFQQALELGGHVRKGEKGSLVVYANRITRKDTDENGDATEKEIPFLKGYTVFNVDQIEALPPQYYTKPTSRFSEPVDRIVHAEQFFASLGADIRERGGRAFYSPSGDYIQIPSINAFPNSEKFYSTLGHEAVHWTKHSSRLARDFGQKSWGDEAYAVEELVAELGAAFLCAHLEITLAERDDHAAYIGSWLKVLKDDKRAIFSAASHAQRAVGFLHERQPEFRIDT